MNRCAMGSARCGCSTRVQTVVMLTAVIFTVLIFIRHDLSLLEYHARKLIGSCPLPLIPNEEQFYNFFDNEFLRDFKEQQLKQRRASCHPIFGAVLERGTGFGSVLNNALSAYLIASDANVDFTFQLFIRPWNYAKLNEFLEDFAAGTSCPVFDTDFNSTKHQLGYNYNLTLNGNGSQLQLSTEHNITAVRHNVDASFTEFRHIANALQERDGVSNIFKRKSLFTKALWNPVPELKSLIKQLWLSALDASGRYIGVHIRRGDKIYSWEMADIPVKSYVEKLVEFCQLRNNSCPTNIFVISDEPAAFRLFREFAENSSFNAVNLAHLVRSAGLREDKIVLSYENLNAPTRYSWNWDIWYKHTRELIISITLMGMAEYVVCTYTSNLCRLTSLLKGDSTFNTTLGMDGSWFVS